MVLSSLVALFTLANLKAAVVGFVLRHVSPALVAKVKAFVAKVKAAL